MMRFLTRFAGKAGERFEIDFKATTDLRTTTRSTQALLMEGMRLLDEANRDASGEKGEDSEGEPKDAGRE